MTTTKREKKSRYVDPKIDKHEKLAEVTAQPAPPISGPNGIPGTPG